LSHSVSLGSTLGILSDFSIDVLTLLIAGASFGILPMVNTWNYLTAYMLVGARNIY